MELLRWMGRTFVRFVALLVALLGGWIFVVNVIDARFDTWVWFWVVLSGLAGLVGGVLVLISYDGPERFRIRRWRIIGWSLMLVSVSLPTSLSLFLVPLVVVSLPGVFMAPTREPSVTSS